MKFGYNDTVKKLTKRIWVSLILFGLFGQLAWAVENMYFNLFIYNTVAKSTRAVTVMVQASGIVGTVTALIMGTVSDRIGNRKAMLSLGYIFWGISTLAFAFINTENIQNIFNIDPAASSGLFGLSGNGATLTVAVTLIAIIVMDCVMTFFGSTANDAAYNTWVTDNVDGKNRSKVESVLSTFPLVALLIVAGGFGLLLGENNNYPRMFYILGGTVTACGVAGLFFVKDRKGLSPEKLEKLWKNLAYGFLPSTVKRYKPFYIVLLAWLLISIAAQIFMPYLVIYLEQYLKFTVIEYSIILGSMVLSAAIVIVILGRVTEKIGRFRMLLIGCAAYTVGLFSIYFVHDVGKTALMVTLAGTGFVMLIGMLLVTTTLGAYLRDFTPVDSAGKLQGARMVAQVLIPMFTGPAIGDAINQAMARKNPDLTYIDITTEMTANIPAPEIFLVGSLVLLTILLPIFLLRREQKKHGLVMQWQPSGCAEPTLGIGRELQKSDGADCADNSQTDGTQTPLNDTEATAEKKV
ncbi:MAG: MFS transporter [Clostridiales bacterium]|jgi:MFS family permease|nr:MFS transporter [Clostridiales bacterium]